MANYQLQIREMNEYFKSTGHFTIEAVRERPFREFHVYEQDGCNRRAFYIQHILENLEKNAKLKDELQKTRKEVIREYFYHQAWLELQVPPTVGGSHKKPPLEEAPKWLLDSLIIYFEMAENVIEIFNKYS